MGAVWIAGAHHDCLLSGGDAELLVGELQQLPPDRYAQAPTAAALLARAREGDRGAPAVSIDAAQRPAVLAALEALLGRRRAFSKGLEELLEILLAETRAGTTAHPVSTRLRS